MGTLVALFCFVLALLPNVFAKDKMYKCEDGTFTNRADLHCPPYELHGQIIVITDGTALAATRDKISQGNIVIAPAGPPKRPNAAPGDHK